MKYVTFVFITKPHLPKLELVYRASNDLSGFNSILNSLLKNPTGFSIEGQESKITWGNSNTESETPYCQLDIMGKLIAGERHATSIPIGTMDSIVPPTVLRKVIPTITSLASILHSETHPHRIVLNHDKDISDSIINEIDLSNKFCPNPFERVEIMHGYGEKADGDIGYGNVHVCCMSYVPMPIGSYLEQNLSELWNSQAAQDIRTGILDGSFRHCNRKLCAKIQEGRLPDRSQLTGTMKEIVEKGRVVLDTLPNLLMLCYDRSCNLACPSCRVQKINHGQGKEFEKADYLTEKLINDLFARPHDQHINLMITGSGDPFASKVYRRLIESIEGKNFPNLTIDLFTNGVLLTPEQWDRLKHVERNIGSISFSIDAATSETYSKVRGGDWAQLMINMAHIGEMLKQKRIRNFETNFVVQKANFREMGDFVRLCRRLGVRAINFSMLVSWNTWSQSEFEEQCIWKKDHPLLPDLLMALRDPDMIDPMVRPGALAAYRELALNSPINTKPSSPLSSL